MSQVVYFDPYIADLTDIYELEPIPIPDFCEKHRVPQEKRPELERVLRTVLLLRGAARALKKAMRTPDWVSPVEPGETVRVSRAVSSLSSEGFLFVVRNPETGELIRSNHVEVTSADEEREIGDDYYRMAAQ